MKAPVTSLLWLLLSGIAEQPAPAEKATTATLIIYRQREFGGKTYDIRIGDKKVGPLPSNRYLQLSVPPGPVKIESVKDYFSDNQTLRLKAQPGRTYYVKAVEEIDFLSQTLLLAPVDEQQGQKELLGVKPARVKPNREDHD